MSGSLMTTYNRLPVSFSRGHGSWLWDLNEAKYLDALSGIAVCNLGHTHPAVVKAVADQSSQLMHTSNLYGIPLQESLGAKLTDLSGLKNVFFGNSGAEANEAAIKLARLFGHQQGIENPAIVVMENSFHGRTMATLSATGNRKVQAGFEPLVQGFIRIPFGDIESLESVAENSSSVVAVLLEPIQGEGGINIPHEGYLGQVRDICDANNWLMMLDEIQTGMGRSGKLFAHQHEGIKPDVLTLAKALGNGMPIGACIAGDKASEVLNPGTHGSTFGGNPLACAAALAVIDTLEGDNLIERADNLGAKILSDLADALADTAGVEEIRGKGLLIGIELDRVCTELVSTALESNLLINVTSERVIRLLPPLTMSDSEADQLVATLTKIILAFLSDADDNES